MFNLNTFPDRLEAYRTGMKRQRHPRVVITAVELSIHTGSLLINMFKRQIKLFMDTFGLMAYLHSHVREGEQNINNVLYLKAVITHANKHHFQIQIRFIA